MVLLLSYILFLHWLGDFCFQSRWMGENKSKSFPPLLAHCVVYGLTMFLGLVTPWTRADVVGYVLLNFLLHMMVDAVTSRITNYCWDRKLIHLFFVMVGLDQFIHFMCLAWTAKWFLGDILR